MKVNAQRLADAVKASAKLVFAFMKRLPDLVNMAADGLEIYFHNLFRGVVNLAATLMIIGGLVNIAWIIYKLVITHWSA